jgi:hypothetical protein
MDILLWNNLAMTCTDCELISHKSRYFLLSTLNFGSFYKINFRLLASSHFIQ